MRLRKLLDDLQTTLWFRPAVWVAGLGLLALLLIAVDERYAGAESYTSIQWLPWVFTGGADGARTMLGSISATALTVATLAYSVIMVAVVQMANAFSPRILRQYLADSGNQHVLGILIGTFLFSLLVLRVVRSTNESSFVPAISVTVAIILALLSIVAFLYFLNRVAHSVEVRHVVHLIYKEGEELSDEIFPATLGKPWEGDHAPALPDGQPAIIIAPSSGYVQFIAPDELLSAVSKADVVVQLESLTGDYVLRNTPLATVWPAEGLDEHLTEAIQHAFQLGRERTAVQDLLFVIRQLNDIALRALSPAVNDPTTAESCIDILGALLLKVAEQTPISPYRCDENGQLRVIAYGPTFEAMVDSAFNQIRHYAANDLICTWRLIEVCGEIGYVATQPDKQAVLWKHIRMVARSADYNLSEPNDRSEVNQRLVIAARLLNQDPRPILLDIEIPRSNRG